MLLIFIIFSLHILLHFATICTNFTALNHYFFKIDLDFY